MKIIAIALSTMFFMAAFGVTQDELELILSRTIPPRDNLMSETSEIHQRELDALWEFRELFTPGWTTNQFISALMLAVTNDYSRSKWTDEERGNIVENAILKLGEINRPVVTNFFGRLTESPSYPCPGLILTSMFRYTNLEPEIFTYLREQCVRTNMYFDAVEIVPIELYDALETMADPLKPSATNRVAQFMYFAIQHTTYDMTFQDRQLARFLPSYSNSVQRLAAMRYIAASATNEHQRVNAQIEVDRLTSLPTNALNNIQWIEHASSRMDE